FEKLYVKSTELGLNSTRYSRYGLPCRSCPFTFSTVSMFLPYVIFVKPRPLKSDARFLSGFFCFAATDILSSDILTLQHDVHDAFCCLAHAHEREHLDEVLLINPELAQERYYRRFGITEFLQDRHELLAVKRPVPPLELGLHHPELALIEPHLIEHPHELFPFNLNNHIPAPQLVYEERLLPVDLIHQERHHASLALAEYHVHRGISDPEFRYLIIYEIRISNGLPDIIPVFLEYDPQDEYCPYIAEYRLMHIGRVLRSYHKREIVLAAFADDRYDVAALILRDLPCLIQDHEEAHALVVLLHAFGAHQLLDVLQDSEPGQAPHLFARKI